jgi:hypothetical protein
MKYIPKVEALMQVVGVQLIDFQFSHGKLNLFDESAHEYLHKCYPLAINRFSETQIDNIIT